jgi:hypothetical protein
MCDKNYFGKSMKPREGMIHRWALVWCIPLVISGAFFAHFKHMENESVEREVRRETEYSRLGKLIKPYYIEPWERDWGDEEPKVGKTYPRELKSGITKAEKAQLTERLEHQLFSLRYKKEIEQDRIGYYRAEDFWRSVSMILLLPLGVPYLIWPLVIAGRWVWRGPSK